MSDNSMFHIISVVNSSGHCNIGICTDARLVQDSVQVSSGQLNLWRIIS